MPGKDEEEAKSRLLAGQATLQEGLALYTRITSRGGVFALELEEAVLRLALKAEPQRQDLIARLRVVLVDQGKPVPDEIEQAFARHAADEERLRDHQQDAFEYHNKSDLKDLDEAFIPIYEMCRPYSMTSVERMYALYQAVKFVIGAGIEGDFVECGVWRGGSMMVVAHTLLGLGVTDRNLYLFDTYQGLPKPDEQKDVDIWGNRAIDGWHSKRIDDERSHWAEAGEEEVRQNLASTGYPAKHMHFVKGMVERTIPVSAPQKIALLRLDTDWYESTKHELLHLWDPLSQHGVLIIDDYGHFRGARQAVDEFFLKRKITPLLSRIDYSGRIAVKI